MSSKLITVRKGHPRSIPFALGVDRLHNNIFDGADGSWMDLAAKYYNANTGGDFNLLSEQQKKLQVDNYMNSTGNNWFGISKKNNIFSKGNLASGGIGDNILALGTTMVGNAIGNFIGGGLLSKAGSVLSGLGDIASKVPIYGKFAGPALKIAAGGVNALIGTSVDQAKLDAANSGTAAYSNFTSNASSLDDIKGPIALANVLNAFKGGVLKKGWAKKENQKIKQQRADARLYAVRSIAGNANNILDDLLNNDLSEYKAFGGPLDGIDISSPIGYAFMSQYLDTKKQDKNMTNMFAGAPSSIFAMGGDKDGGFRGAGAGGSWSINDPDNYPYNTYPNAKDQNEAFDMAVADGRRTFWFQGREYNTRKEHNPVREYNNRWVGAGRRTNVKNPSKAYDHLAGPIGGPLSLIPIVTDTHVGSPDRPPQLNYNPGLGGESILVDKGVLNNMFFPTYLPRSPKIQRAYGGNLTDEEVVNIMRTGGPKKAYHTNKRVRISPKTETSKGWTELSVSTRQGSSIPFLGNTELITELVTPDKKDTTYLVRPSLLTREYYRSTDKDRTDYDKVHRRFVDLYNDGVTETGIGNEDIIDVRKYDIGGNLFDIGGVLQEHGGNFSTNVTHVNTGGTHEGNPYEGVLMGVDSQGTPNLVEEGEVIYNDYVFSNRLTIPKHKYAKGGKLGKNAEDIPYELKVLRKFEGLTFADAAKRIEKLTGADERVADEIAIKGMEAQLEVLAQVQEKEREKEKLKELQEAIDNMTPEEFEAWKQLMQTQMQLLEQELALALQLAMLEQAMQELGMAQQGLPSPEEAALILAALEALLLLQVLPPALMEAALGGLLNTPSNMYPYGGTLGEYEKELLKYGLTLADYVVATLEDEGARLFVRENYNANPEAYLNTDNFDREFAEKFLKRVKTTEKQYERRAKRQGIKIDNLPDYAKAQYNRELTQAIQRSISDPNYDVNEDNQLSFNSTSVNKAKDKQQAYNNVTEYNDLLARGAKKVSLDNKGRVMWDPANGLKKIDNSAEDFYTNLGNLSNEDLGNRGIYDYNNITTSSLDGDDFSKIGLRGWTKNDDGTYRVTDAYVNPDKYSLIAGNSKKTYKISDLDDLKYGLKGYKEALDAIQKDADYTALTDAVLSSMLDGEGNLVNFNDLNPRMLNYFRYLDLNTANEDEKLLLKDNAGNYYLNPGDNGTRNAYNLYRDRRKDNLYGIYHYLFDENNSPSASRYYYMDGNNKVYVEKPGEEFTVSDKPEVITGNDGTTFNDYEVTGLNKNRKLIKLANGVLDVTNADGDWKDLDKPVLEDNKDNLGYGINGTSSWVGYDDGNDTGIPFPEETRWPYLMAGLGLLGSTAWNILSPKDYKNADALIKAGMQAGNYMPISYNPRGNFHRYVPDDPWFYTSPILALSNSTLKAIQNKNLPSADASTLANSYNTMTALGQALRQQLEHNFDKEFKTIEANNALGNTWSEGFLKADMANQDAFSRAQGFNLEGQKAGYTMRLAIDDARANAINSNLNSAINLGITYAQSKDYMNLLKYRARTGTDGTGIYFDSDKRDKGAAKGGRIRKRKGLSF